jgi:glycosyltransferase involved in cell wall biosynthesis
MSGALYICYFGLREPLVQTQVLPYLRELAKGGYRMSLLTFERRAFDQAEWRERLRRDGIEWHALPYHKSVPLKLVDIARGVLRAAAIARRERIEIFHGRSHVGTVIGALARKLAGGRLIFDIRGLLADEYIDSGNWRRGGLLYRLAKAVERWLIRTADGFVVLTEAARDELQPRVSKPIEVIPCCVDVERFANASPADLGVAGRTVYAYAGSLGGYYLTHELADLLAVARRRDPRTFALVLTQSPAPLIADELERRGFTRDDYRVINAAPEEVPRYLASADVGLFVIRPSYARRWSSPTKFAEYLAAGLPVIATAGIGDLDEHTQSVGALLPSHDEAAYAAAIERIDELCRDDALAARCRAGARAKYDLESVGGVRYRRLYERVRRLRVMALASYPRETAASRFRIVQYIEPLARRGIELRFSPFLDASLFAALYKPSRLLARSPRLLFRALTRLGAAFRRADVFFVQREAMLFGPPLVEWMAARVRRRSMLLDLDDATWLPYSSPIYGRLAMLLKFPRKTNLLIRWAGVVTCGSPNVAAYAASLGAETVLLPTVVDLRVFHPRTTVPPDVPVVGWIGTHGTFPFLERLLPLLERLRTELPFELAIIGSGEATDTRPWQLEREPEDFRSLDVGLYPIADDAWSAAKSGFKAIQYMASGVPFVMSPVGVCATMGIAGETHFLAATEDEWAAALRRLIADPALRARMGAAGRAFAERHYALEAHADALADAIRKTLSARRRAAGDRLVRQRQQLAQQQEGEPRGGDGGEE